MATILLVEDHYMSRQLLRTLFESTGHRVLEAANGWTALTLARNNHLDLIITDILLPTMDGVVFAQRLRVSACDSIPIIFIRLPAVCERSAWARAVGAVG